MTKKLKFITVKKHYQILAKRWQMYTEPGRPGREDIFYYNQLTKIALGKKKGAKVVILGATPEIRDMLYKYYLTNKIKVICVDMMPEMYQAMTELVTVKIPGERFIHSNWLKMKFPKNSIDIVIGDLVIGNLRSYQDRLAFLKKINQILKKDGYFISRHWLATPQSQIKNIKQELFSLALRVIDEELTLKQAVNYLWTRLLIGSWWRNKMNTTSIVYYNRELKELIKYFNRKKMSDKDKIAKAIFHLFLKLTTGQFWSYFSKAEEIKQLERFFVIKRQPTSKYCIMSINAPIYLLKPKK